eukprot:3941981-Rhodomonas_salina.1
MLLPVPKKAGGYGATGAGHRSLRGRSSASHSLLTTETLPMVPAYPAVSTAACTTIRIRYS